MDFRHPYRENQSANQSHERDAHPTAADTLHRYHVRVKGVETNPRAKQKVTGERLKKGDIVWINNRRGKCTTKYGVGRVTEVISKQAVWVDGVPRHIKDIRSTIHLRPSEENESESESETSETSLWFALAP